MSAEEWTVTIVERELLLKKFNRTEKWLCKLSFLTFFLSFCTFFSLSSCIVFALQWFTSTLVFMCRASRFRPPLHRDTVCLAWHEDTQKKRRGTVSILIFIRAFAGCRLPSLLAYFHYKRFSSCLLSGLYDDEEKITPHDLPCRIICDAETRQLWSQIGLGKCQMSKVSRSCKPPVARTASLSPYNLICTTLKLWNSLFLDFTSIIFIP